MNMTPEQLDMILGSGDSDPEVLNAKRAQARIDMLRRQAEQPVGMLDAGRLRMANFGGIAQQYRNRKTADEMQPQVDEQVRQSAARDKQAKGAFLDAMIMGMRKQYPTSAIPTLPPDGMEDR